MSEVKISFDDFTRSVSQGVLARHSKLFVGRSSPLREYHVRSPVRRENLDLFLTWLEHPAEANITVANISDFSLLCAEFGVLELFAKHDISSSSTVFNSHICSQQIEAIWNCIGRLEETMSSSATEIRNMKIEFERRLSICETDINQLKSTLPAPGSTSSPLSAPMSPPVCPSPIPHPVPRSLEEVEFPLPDPNSLDGIIAYLTRKHGGNVQDNGIVTITSKSVSTDDPKSALRNVADLTFDTCFCSRNEPGQWVCWYFHDVRVRPTHYTIKSYSLKSWVIEGSLDCMNWTEIARKNNYDLEKLPFVASFAVSKQVESRFIRLTQTGLNNRGTFILRIDAFECFGTLLE
jgi:hypothetical protein